MRTRNVSPRTPGWLLPAATKTRGLLAAATDKTRGLMTAAAMTSALLGCPNQELAPLAPCTVSGVSLEVPQSGVDKVDILFMIDNSGSMSEEQKKLSAVLPLMVKVLTTGNASGMPSTNGAKPEFPPVQSLHIGVVSSDMGVNGAPAQRSCGGLSFIPTEQNNLGTQMFLNKPLGDDGQLQTSTAVAVAGIFAGTPVMRVVPGDPACAAVQFPPGQRFIDFTAGVTDPNDTATRFGCVAKLGKNGCGLEQQLESALKALTPPDSPTKFTSMTNGNGTAINPTGVSGVNGKFLREDAILAVVFVTDEEDCSIPDSSNAIFDAASTSIPGEINVRCGLPENQRYLHDVQKRYVAGLKALKPMAYQDRLIVASIVGIPVKENLGGGAVHTGTAAIDMILARPDMQFKVQRNMAGNADEPVPTCISAKGDGSAAPARRFLELTKQFGENGVVTSVCEDDYTPALKVVIDKIAAQLTGACLPRKLNPGSDGKVACDVVEIKAAGSQVGCDPNKGRSERLPDRKVGNSTRVVCRMNQVPNGQGGEGWYYDESSNEVQTQCKRNPQRIAFTGNANPDPGAQAKFECFQPVASGVDEEDKNRQAVNLSCKQDPVLTTKPYGDAVCDARESQTSGAVDLICVSGTCQIACTKLSDCPDGWVCTSEGGQNFCVNPTCPPAEQ